MPELVLLDWRETLHKERPTPQQVKLWLTQHGYQPTETPRVHANGQVAVEVEDANQLEELWQSFTPPSLSYEDKLAGHITAMMAAREDLLAVPRKTLEQEALLAVINLLAYGYGVPLD
jgi:hypothetical protein